MLLVCPHRLIDLRAAVLSHPGRHSWKAAIEKPSELECLQIAAVYKLPKRWPVCLALTHCFKDPAAEMTEEQSAQGSGCALTN